MELFCLISPLKFCPDLYCTCVRLLCFENKLKEMKHENIVKRCVDNNFSPGWNDYVTSSARAITSARIRDVTRTLIGVRGGVYHIFMFCPTSFFSNRHDNQSRHNNYSLHFTTILIYSRAKISAQQAGLKLSPG